MVSRMVLFWWVFDCQSRSKNTPRALLQHYDGLRLSWDAAIVRVSLPKLWCYLVLKEAEQGRIHLGSVPHLPGTWTSIDGVKRKVNISNQNFIQWHLALCVVQHQCIERKVMPTVGAPQRESFKHPWLNHVEPILEAAQGTLQKIRPQWVCSASQQANIAWQKNSV